ncbi:amphi-Trp domain-containing protein [Micromonospora sp. NPDC049049]|uniref:amphi-Trp domain-containing protein n=1 Tax=Micromonospora sp. NPDC049049 TaxID=3155495 RepID=UPI00340E034D
MAGMDIYEDARTVSRSDLAAWLRQLANQLETDGRLFYGAAGAVSVADTVRCELEIERESETEVSVEIEFSWTEPTSTPAANEVEEPSSGEQQAEVTPEA